MRFWRNVANVVDEADVIVEVVDARMPFLARNKRLVEMLGKAGKEHIIVFNKSDLVSKGFQESILRNYKGNEAFFVSAKVGTGLPRLRLRLRILSKKSKFERLRVGFVGYPNVGKSAVINALVRRAKTMVSAKAGTTRGVHWVSFSNFKILDSPGVIPNDEWDEVKLGIVGAKDPIKIKDLEKVALAIIDIFIEGDLTLFAKTYKIDIKDIEGKENWEILEEMAKAKKLLVKGGLADEKRAALMIVRDWQSGKLNLIG